MKINRIFLFLTLISNWSGYAQAGEYENIVNDLKAQGLDPENSVQLSSLEGLKVELAMNPYIRSALASAPMRFLETLPSQLKLLVRDGLISGFNACDRRLQPKIKKELEKIKQLDSSDPLYAAKKKELDEAIKKWEETRKLIYTFQCENNTVVDQETLEKWNAIKEQMKIVDDAEIKQIEQEIKNAEKKWFSGKTVRDLKMRLAQLESDKALAKVIKKEQEEFLKKHSVPIEHPELIQRFEALEKNMGTQERKLRFGTTIKEGILGAYGASQNIIKINPLIYSVEQNTQQEYLPNYALETTMAHEMGHAKYNPNAERYALAGVGGVTGYEVLKTLGRMLRMSSSRPARAGLFALGVAAFYGGLKLGESLAEKHSETVAEVAALEHALPIYNAPADKKYDEAIRTVYNGSFHAEGSEAAKRGYLTKKQALYAAQRMYKPELHKPYEMDNNPGQFLADHGGI